MPSSPCIGAGASEFSTATDVLGNPRGTNPDVGAYEHILDSPIEDGEYEAISYDISVIKPVYDELILNGNTYIAEWDCTNVKYVDTYIISPDGDYYTIDTFIDASLGEYTFTVNKPGIASFGYSFYIKSSIDYNTFNSQYINFPCELSATLLEAASDGLIGGYLYRYDNYNDKYGPPILVTFPYTLSPYESYWIEVLQDDLTLVSEYPSSGEDSPLYPHSLESDKWYQVTLPINPSQTGSDVRDTFLSWSNGELSADTYGNSWRIYKYKYDAVGTGLSDKMFHYGDTGSFNNSMAPGQGYIFKYIAPGETFDRFVVPDATGPTTDVRLKIPFHPDVDDDEFTLHLVGNPFRRNLDMSSNVTVEWPMDDSAPLAKPVSIPLDQIETWYIGLRLESDTNPAINDEYNRAGVAINYSGSTRPLCALDMVPMDDYLRLVLRNPSDDTGTPFAYDIRPAGDDSYTWNMELTTTYDEIDAKLMFDSLESIPEGYEFTLTDKATGTAITIDNNTILDVALSSSKPREYELTATAISTGIDESGRPTAFGITGTMPNPFNPVVTIAYSLEESRNMTLNIYNISGQLVDTLIDGRIEAGRHSVVWNAAGHASGTYIVSLEVEGKRDIRKITFMK